MAQSKLDTHSYLLDEGFEVYEIKTNAWIDFIHGDSTFKKKRMNSKYMIFWLNTFSYCSQEFTTSNMITPIDFISKSLK